MIEIRLIGTDTEIYKALECLRNEYRIGSNNKLHPAANGKYRCYLRAFHKKQCILCMEHGADEDTGLCTKCLSVIEEEM